MKRISMFLVALLFFVLTYSETTSAAVGFHDVGDTHPAKNEIHYLAQQGIINGYPDGEFGVNDEITRLQASSIIIRALGLQTNDRPVPKFSDVKEGDYGYSIIATIADEGIIQGVDGQFKPSDKLTRAQMAAILVRAFNLQGESSYLFRDVSAEHWAAPSIKALVENKITMGFADNTYKPNQPITRAHFAVFTARVLNPEFRQTEACYVPNNEQKHVVNVAVTTLWAKPNLARVVDRPAVSKPVDLAKWSTELTYNQKLWTLGKIDSQALYGQEVQILEEQGDWLKIAVKDQTTPKLQAGYPGWVPKSHISEYYSNYEDCHIAIVSANKANLYNSMSTDKKSLEVSFNTILPVLQEKGDWITVQTPTYEKKYMRKSDVKIVESYAKIKKPTQDDLVETGKQFLNLPYMWGGTSAYGFDCSGFTYSVYKQHGIFIPRDSTAQAVNGQAVAKKDLQPGDLLFFAYQKGKGTVHHVSMYIGDGQMIHAPNYSKSLEIISINQEPYQSEYAGARRYLK